LPEAERDQQMMQIEQRADRNTRQPDLHPGTRGQVEHPGAHDDNDPRRRFEVRDLTVGAPLPVVHADLSPEQRVPRIVDDRISPDMGRMTP
jgi:hypothetical protein